MQLKHVDTRFIAITILVYTGVAIALWRWMPEGAWLPALVLALLLILVVQHGLYRAGERAAETRMRQNQALMALHALIPLRAPLPALTGWAASPELAATLYRLVRQHRPRKVVELGSGASTLVLAYTLEQNGEGHVVSVDHDVAYGEETRQRLETHGLAHYAEVRSAPLVSQQVGESSHTWYDVRAFSGLSGIDLLVVDGPPQQTQHEARYPAVPALYDRLSPQAIIVLDDANRAGEQNIIRRWQERYPDLVLEMADSPKGSAILRRTGAPRAE